MTSPFEQDTIVLPGRKQAGVAVAGVVYSQGHLLMVERAGGHGDGTWSVPGGWVEYGENPNQAVVRELMEETGLLVRPQNQIGWTNLHEGDIHCVTLWIDCFVLGGTMGVMEPDKCPRVEWVPLGKIPQLPMFSSLARFWEELRDYVVESYLR